MYFCGGQALSVDLQQLYSWIGLFGKFWGAGKTLLALTLRENGPEWMARTVTLSRERDRMRSFFFCEKWNNRIDSSAPMRE
jgi:hypothetical protein